MRIFGIDPAPRKGGMVFDGSEWHKFTPSELAAFVKWAHSLTDKVLLCWDAPLTGPKYPDLNPQFKRMADIHKIKDIIDKEETDFAYKPHDFTMRPIDSYYNKETPKGISVLGYAQCPHWTITRNIVGLPRVGEFDKDYDQLPFKLIASEEDKDGLQNNDKGKYIVEVHPALAIWLFLKKKYPKKKTSWSYKGNNALDEVKERFVKEFSFLNVSEKLSVKDKDYDDKLDSYIAWLLGDMWIKENELHGKKINVIGNRELGSFLLPIGDSETASSLVKEIRAHRGDKV